MYNGQGNALSDLVDADTIVFPSECSQTFAESEVYKCMCYSVYIYHMYVCLYAYLYVCMYDVCIGLFDIAHFKSSYHY